MTDGDPIGGLMLALDALMAALDATGAISARDQLDVLESFMEAAREDYPAAVEFTEHLADFLRDIPLDGEPGQLLASSVRPMLELIRGGLEDDDDGDNT